MPDSDWRDRLMAVFNERVDEQTKFVLQQFAVMIRSRIRRYVDAGVSDVMVRLCAVQAVQRAYMIVLERCGIPYEDPSPEFISVIIDDILDEVRASRASRS